VYMGTCTLYAYVTIILLAHAGTVYMLFEPLLLQSINNQFVFRCVDGIHIDGKDRGLSKMIYK